MLKDNPHVFLMYSIILYMWAFQVLSAGFQGGCVTHASIVGRREEETNKGETDE